MAWAAVIGAGASIAGGMLSKPKAPKFKPFNISNSSGDVRMDKKGLKSTESRFNQGARDFFENQFSDFSSDPNQQVDYGRGLVSTAQGGFMPAFQNAQNAGFDNSNGYMNQFMGDVGNMQNTFGQVGAEGMNAAFGSPTAAGQTDFANNAAAGLFGQAGNFDQMAAERKAQFDAMALPQEQQATRSAMQGLFGSGRLGTTGGANQMGALAQAQMQADTQRGVAASDFALGHQNSLLNQSQGFLGLGLNGTGMDQSRGLGLGQIGGNAMGQLPGLSSMGLGATVGQDTRNITRAQERLSGMEGLFGFGNAMTEQPAASAGRALGSIGGLDARQDANTDAALRGSSIRSKQGGVPAGANPMGAMLSGFGTGMMNRGMNTFFDKRNASSDLNSLMDNNTDGLF